MNDRILKLFYFPADSANKLPAQDCSHQVSGNAADTQTNQMQQTLAAGRDLPHSGSRPWPRPSNDIKVPAGQNTQLHSSQSLQTFPNLNLSPHPEDPTSGTQVNLQILSHPDHLMSQTQDQHVFASPTGDHLPNFPPRFDQLPGGRMEMAKTQEVAGYQPHSQYDPSQTSQLHPFIQPPAQYSPDPTGSSELVLSGSDKTYIHSNTKHTASKNTVPDLSVQTQGSVSTEPTSTAISQADQYLERQGSIARRNTDRVQSRVQNIRVKPLGKFLSSGHHLNQKPSVQQANSQISNPYQYGTGLTAVSSDENRWMSQQHRGSNIRKEHMPERSGFSILNQEQDVHSVRIKLDQTAVIRPTDLSPDQQGQQQRLVQSVVESGTSGGQKSASAQRKVFQPTGRDENRQPLTNMISH